MKRLVPWIIGINVVVFLMWHQYGEDSSFMFENFLVSGSALQEGRYWTLITSVFSHNLFFHIFINMYVLSSFGSIMELTLGAKRFFMFYMGAGIISSLSHVLVSTYILQQPETPALGASGAIAGLILIFSLVYPKEKISLFGIIPLPAIWGAVLFIALDIWGLVAQAEGGGLPIGHGAHLGGAFAGILYYLFYLRPLLQKRASSLR